MKLVFWKSNISIVLLGKVTLNFLFLFRFFLKSVDPKLFILEILPCNGICIPQVSYWKFWKLEKRNCRNVPAEDIVNAKGIFLPSLSIRDPNYPKIQSSGTFAK